MTRIYCLSGLGADKSVFENINIDGVELIHLSWLPFKQQDTLKSYAEKMLTLIEERKPLILGVSFGGMLASEIASMIEVRKVISISSAKERRELKSWLFLLKPLLRFIPSFLFSVPNPLLFYFFGVENKEDKNALADVVKKSNGLFVKRALIAVLNWEKQGYTNTIVHIHGTKDKVLHPREIKADHWINGAGHFMIFNRADEINELIKNELKGA